MLKHRECIKAEIQIAEEEKKLRMSKLEQEEELSILKLKKQLIQNETKLAECLKTEGEYFLSESDLKTLPVEDKVKDVHECVNKHQLNPSVMPCFQSEKEQSIIKQDNSSESLSHIVSTLEKCMNNIANTNSRLVEASLMQARATDNLALSSQLPKMSVPVFTGDPLEYPIWNSTFYALVGSKQMDVQSKMNLLSQYVSGKPKQVVDYYMLIGTNQAYKEARELLHERYGNENVVSTAFISKLDSWPKVNAKDPNSLRMFSDMLKVGFISQKLCDKLQVKGPSTQLLLSTVQEQNVLIDSNRICGIEVLDYLRETCIELPPMFTREKVPGNHLQIPKVSVVSKWSHLKGVAEKLMPGDSGIEISLLIANNCPKAIRPREVVVGEEDDPYGQKSLLGWGVIGRLCKSKNDDCIKQSYCNQIFADDRSSKFVFPTTVKETISPDKILLILESDFNKGDGKGKPYSVQDERFLMILKDGIKKVANGHYEMPLPLKTVDLSFPNNRPLAEKRLWQLGRRFKNNKQFHDDYQKFMADILDDYAEKVPEIEMGNQGNLINYIPHTGVYHPKNKKIRIIFDSSAQYRGVSLNQELLQGPDLNNDLVGILLRFREEPVAFLADIKGMFHKFHVAEQHRNFLRFLWWEEGNPNNKLLEYRMKVHLFGATSSPGCANFGLK